LSVADEHEETREDRNESVHGAPSYLKRAFGPGAETSGSPASNLTQ
jgi:hypothetical protein